MHRFRIRFHMECFEKGGAVIFTMGSHLTDLILAQCRRVVKKPVYLYVCTHIHKDQESRGWPFISFNWATETILGKHIDRNDVALALGPQVRESSARVARTQILVYIYIYIYIYNRGPFPGSWARKQ